MGSEFTGYLSAGGGLGVTVALLYLFWKFNNSSETIYSRRAQDQIVTIADLESHAKIARQELDECHKERVELAGEVTMLRVHVERLEYKVNALENK